MSNWLVSGCTGMDGSHAIDFLIDKEQKVTGIVRRVSTSNLQRIKHILNHPNFNLVESDITDSGSISNLVNKQFDYIINYAAQSHVKTSFEVPYNTFEINVGGVLNFLESIRLFAPTTHFLQASSSEQWGNNFSKDENGKPYQDLKTPWAPRSPYGIAKLAAHELVRVYRESYNLFVCSSVCHNHESSRRGSLFVTKKCSEYVAKLHHWYKNQNDICGKGDFSDLFFDDEYIIHTFTKSKFNRLKLGNVTSFRDWSHAKDIVNGQYLILQQDQPDDYVLSSDIAHSVQEFIDLAFSYIGISNAKPFYCIDESLYRPSEVDYLRGKSDKARKVLGWQPEVSFEELVKEMVNSDIEALNEEKNSVPQKEAVT